MYPTGCSRPHVASIGLELSWLFVIIPSGLWQARGQQTDKEVTWPLSQQRCLRLGGFTLVEEIWIDFVGWLCFCRVILDLTSVSLPKLQYLFSMSILGIFAQAAHQNYRTCGACSENAMKMVIFIILCPKIAFDEGCLANRFCRFCSM